MELEKYDETIHPEVWLNKIKIYCYKNNITKNEDILEFCKATIHPSIIVSKASTFDEILSILKSDIFFISFKFSIKEKLRALKFNLKNESHTQFINKFREYCFEAEINDIEEQKNLLLKTFSKDSSYYNFINDNLEKIKSLNDLIVFFNQAFLEEKKLVKYGSRIALKHVATGKYLSSRGDIRYKSNSNGPIVFAEQNFSSPDAVWIISKNSELLSNESHEEPFFYGERFYLFHKATERMLDIDKRYESPTTKHAEVTTLATGTSPERLQLTATSSVNNDGSILSNDIITLKNSENYILRSHGFTFNINDQTYQEVVGHNERISGNDVWCIENVENVDP